MLSTQTALIHTVVLGGVIFFCRALPFIIFREKTEEKNGIEKDYTKDKDKLKSFFEFVEFAVPAVAMTVLAFNALASPIKEGLSVLPPDLAEIIPLGIAALVTALVHIWKRNPLLSILGGTALYMLINNLII